MAPTPDVRERASIDRVSADGWRALASRRVYFGHHSVGDNILDGMRQIMNERPGVRVRITEASDAGALCDAGLAHGRVGVNQDPESKIRDFERVVGEGVGGRADIAFFKFCYVDFGSGTEPARLFDAYARAMQGLAQRFPRVRFCHITTPLTVPPGGLKTSLKMALGKLSWEHEANLRREEYNGLLRTKFGGGSTVFDLARLESVEPDGSAAAFAWKGSRHPVLARCYAADEGHLGPLGQRVIAGEMLAWLAGLTGGGA